MLLEVDLYALDLRRGCKRSTRSVASRVSGIPGKFASLQRSDKVKTDIQGWWGWRGNIQYHPESLVGRYCLHGCVGSGKTIIWLIKHIFMWVLMSWIQQTSGIFRPCMMNAGTGLHTDAGQYPYCLRWELVRYGLGDHHYGGCHLEYVGWIFLYYTNLSGRER